MGQKILKVGIIGLGRSGRDIHGQMLIRMKSKFEIVAAADPIADRQARARQEYGCRTYDTWEEMINLEELDLVVNASLSHLHFSSTMTLLERGFNVLCEKPLVKKPEEVDQLIEASKRSGKLLTVFQQSRYLPSFEKVCEVIESGVLGRIIQIDITFNGFGRRWDMQTLQRNDGGNLMNTGPHAIDQAIHLVELGEQPQITCVMDRVNTFGDAEDYVKLLMRAPNRPVIDIEMSSSSAYPNEQYNIQGSNGGLHGTRNHLEWKYFKPEEAPEQKLSHTPLHNSEGLPVYCKETLLWHSDQWTNPFTNNDDALDYMTEKLYVNLYDHLTTGRALDITLEQVRQQMWIMKECRRQNPDIYESII